WRGPLRPGDNPLGVVARRDAVTVNDELTWGYQIDRWGTPARLAVQAGPRQGDLLTVEVRALDPRGVACLDARTVVRFGLTGDGRLVDNLGTSTGSRQVELYNGRASIQVRLGGGRSTVSVHAQGLPTGFVSVG